MRTFVRLALTLALAVSAWGEKLSSATAGEVIDKTLKSTTVGITLELGRIGTGCANKPADVNDYDPTNRIEFIAAQRAGFIAVKSDGVGFWKVEIADIKPPTAEALKKIPHKTANGCDYQRLSFLVAQKTLVDVVTVKQVANTTAEVDFTWKWVVSGPFAKLMEQLSPAEQGELEGYFETLFPPPSKPHFKFSEIGGNAQPHSSHRTLRETSNGWALVFDNETAIQVIEAKLEREHKTIVVPIGRVGFYCPGHEDIMANFNPENDISVGVARKAGYVSVVPDIEGYSRIELTDRGVTVTQRSFGPLALSGCDFQLVNFDVAKPTLVKIAAITGDDNAPEVDYLWKWVPTELGQALSVSGEVYRKLTPLQRESLRRYFATTDFAPALPFPVPSLHASAVATRSKLQLSKSGSTWMWH